MNSLAKKSPAGGGCVSISQSLTPKLMPSLFPSPSKSVAANIVLACSYDKSIVF